MRRPPRPSLHADTRGSGPRLVLAHGFTQTGRVWGTLDTDLARDHQVVTVDLPGHGRSSTVRAGLIDGALALGRVGGPAAYLGYSMGARFCLHLALARPDLVRSLVLISGTAGIDDEGERRSRRHDDAALAEQLDPSPPGRAPVAVAQFVREWLDRPLFAGVPPDAAGLAERERNTSAGLASSLRLAGTGAQRPLWDELHHLRMPVLVVCGQRDEKFTTLGERMVDCIGRTATLAVVAGAGHAPHLQRPGQVAALVRRHLNRRPA
jgi:2-succinyl-6-hydroxy-2,4-cyclohexadiene-1-carboxylate synthase